jgi:hypothetical protein
MVFILCRRVVGFGVVTASALNIPSVIIVCLDYCLSLGYLALLHLGITVNSRFVSHGCDYVVFMCWFLNLTV